MAIDFLLLQRYPDALAPRFRHYEWRAPAFTFGYAQKISFVRAQLAAQEGSDPDAPNGGFDLCRRPTGGGLVDHRDDWTYALGVPRGHPLEEQRATASYRVVHEALADALRSLGVECLVTTAPATVDPSLPRPGALAEGICFERAEVYDVVAGPSGAKIAGAAQKRNRHGLLFQGSIWKPAAGGAAIDWEAFAAAFTARLGTALAAPPEARPWPDFDEDEVAGLSDRYSSAEWTEFR
jgi:lipoate-protein ligase A